MNIFRLTVIKFCIVFFIPLKVYSQSTEIYTDLRGNKYAAINDKGMVKYKVEDRSKNTNFRSYIQLYKYDSNDNPQEEKDENGNDVFVYRTTRHTERQKEGGCDWKVSGYFLVSPDIVNSEGIAKAQTMDWATANGYLTVPTAMFIRLPVLQLPGDVPHIAGKMVWMKLELGGYLRVGNVH